MKEVVNRTPTKPNRMLITPEGGGAAFYATVVRADEPTAEGTPVGRALFMALQGMEPCSTIFNVDGSVTETYETGVLTTTFPDSSHVVETFVPTAGSTVTKTTTFNVDGSISEVIS